MTFYHSPIAAPPRLLPAVQVFHTHHWLTRIQRTALPMACLSTQQPAQHTTPVAHTSTRKAAAPFSHPVLEDFQALRICRPARRLRLLSPSFTSIEIQLLLSESANTCCGMMLRPASSLTAWMRSHASCRQLPRAIRQETSWEEEEGGRLSLCLLCRYPNRYTLLFISLYSPAYTGFHWAVYNQNQMFYGFEDGDITSGGAAAIHMLQQALL